MHLLIDAQRLEDALVRATRPIVPSPDFEGRGLVPALLESWDPEKEFAAAVQWVASKYLEELQDDVMLATREVWPPVGGGVETPEPAVEVEMGSGLVRLSFATKAGERLLLSPIPFGDFSDSRPPPAL